MNKYNQKFKLKMLKRERWMEVGGKGGRIPLIQYTQKTKVEQYGWQQVLDPICNQGYSNLVAEELINPMDCSKPDIYNFPGLVDAAHPQDVSSITDYPPFLTHIHFSTHPATRVDHAYYLLPHPFTLFTIIQKWKMFSSPNIKRKLV